MARMRAGSALPVTVVPKKSVPRGQRVGRGGGGTGVFETSSIYEGVVMRSFAAVTTWLLSDGAVASKLQHENVLPTVSV